VPQQPENLTAPKAADIAADLAPLVRGDVYDDIIHRAAFATDASIYQLLPACVIAPKTPNDIVVAVKYAAANKIPVVARGAGSGVAGESLGTGIVFDVMKYMNKILAVENDGSLVTCEPGVVLDELNKKLAPLGRMIGPDPSTSNRATVGGCVANNATGSHSLRYGYIGDFVHSIEAVLADGQLVEFKNDFTPKPDSADAVNQLGQECLSLLSENKQIIEKALPRTKRNRSGYSIAGIAHENKIDLARMLAGSEGTLCVFTKITLRTVLVPAAKGLLRLEFKTLGKMADAVPVIVAHRADACELLDNKLIKTAIQAYPEYREVLPDSAAAILIVEHTGDNPERVKQKLQQTADATTKFVTKHDIIIDAEQQRKIEKARKDAVPLLNRNLGGKKPVPFIEDVSVDNSQLGKYIIGMQTIAAQYDFDTSFYGHAGDGELHVRPYLDLADPSDVQKMPVIANEVFDLAWSLGGTISGEHADGLVRAAFIKKQYGPQFYDLLRRVKEIFDPNLILNPDKIISDDPDIMTKNLRASHEVAPELLAGDLKIDHDELAEELEKCNGCGLCLNNSDKLRFCPVYRAVGDELASSRAKANVLRFWSTGQIDEKDFYSPEFRKFLDLCVNCKACVTECPSGVDVSKLIGAARAKYAKRKGMNISQKVLSNNRLLSITGSTFGPLANFATNLAITKWVLEKTMGLDKRRSLPKFAGKSFIKTGSRYLQSLPPVDKPVDKVAYFVDTYANYNDHELGFAVLDVLRRNNIEVIIPKQRPAPLPAVCYGDTKRAKRDLEFSVKYLAQAVRDGYKIICSEPSAALCLKDELKNYVTGDDAKLVTKSTFELMNYLLDLHNQNKLAVPKDCKPQKYLYHLPCHLCAVGSGRATAELFRRLCKSEVIDIQAGCCGIAGTFGMQKKNYELSTRIAANVKKTLEKSKVDYVLTECSACKMQIEHISNKTVTHPIKVLAQSYAQT
jgi:anaerobic glycerol-3-phosphate dehydrogenase C subunit